MIFLLSLPEQMIYIMIPLERFLAKTALTFVLIESGAFSYSEGLESSSSKIS